VLVCDGGEGERKRVSGREIYIRTMSKSQSCPEEDAKSYEVDERDAEEDVVEIMTFVSVRVGYVC
jgi:hypothetical protein